MSDSKRKPMSTTERQAALRKAGVGDEIIKEVGALGEMLCKETKMENDKRAERRYLDAGFYLFFGGSVGLVLGVAANFIVIAVLSSVALVFGVACRFVGHRKQGQRIRNLPPPPMANKGTRFISSAEAAERMAVRLHDLERKTKTNNQD